MQPRMAATCFKCLRGAAKERLHHGRVDHVDRVPCNLRWRAAHKDAAHCPAALRRWPDLQRIALRDALLQHEQVWVALHRLPLGPVVRVGRLYRV